MRVPESPSRDETAVATPIFLAHNNNRATVSNREGQHAANALEMADYDVEWMVYLQAVGQPVPYELDHIVSFIHFKVGLAPYNYDYM